MLYMPKRPVTDLPYLAEMLLRGYTATRYTPNMMTFRIYNTHLQELLLLVRQMDRDLTYQLEKTPLPPEKVDEWEGEEKNFRIEEKVFWGDEKREELR